MKNLKRLDRSVFKYNPDQMVFRLNDVIDTLNKQNISLEQQSTVVDSKEVLIYGMQPDGTFGIAKWDREGDQYTNKVMVI